MNHKRRILALALALLFGAAFVSPAFAEKSQTEGKVGTNIIWKFSGQTLTLSGKGKLSLGFAAYDYPWAQYKAQIKKVVIKEGITMIPGGAFLKYGKLAALSLPKSMVDFPLNAMMKTPWYKAQKNGVIYLNGIACGYKGKLSATLKLKDGTKSVASDAFSSNNTLQKVQLPDSVAYIGESAFSSCENLSEINVPRAVRFVGGYAFDGTPWLGKQPDGVVYFGKVACCCNGKIPANGTVKLKNGTVAVAPAAFFCQEDLTKIQMPDSVKTIGYDAFYGTKIHTLSIPKSVTVIDENKVGARFFSKISVDPANQVYSSDQNGCLFNKKKTQLYEYPGMSKAKTYRIPGTVKSIHSLCFDGALNLETLIIPASVKYIDLYGIYYADTLRAFKVDKQNANYSSDASGCLYNKNKTTLLRYPIGKPDQTFTVPKQVKKIGSLAFLQAWNLKTIKMYDNVTTIGSDAFYRCYSLETIRFSKNITKIEGEMFAYIPWIDKQPAGVIYVGKVAYRLNGDLKKLTIKDGTVSIAEDAFWENQSLQTVVIPKSVAAIGRNAFADATGIKTIRINNPQCEIPMEAGTFPKQAVLYGAKGSTTQAYAKAFGRKFVAV